MATRYLRKVYGEDEIIFGNGEDSGDAVAARTSESKLFNIFDLVIIFIIHILFVVGVLFKSLVFYLSCWCFIYFI